MSRDQVIFVIESHKIRTPGISYGYGDNHLEIMEQKGDYLLVKKKGTQDWGGIGFDADYWPVEYWLCRKRIQLSPDKFRVEIMFSIQPSKRWRRVKEIMTDMLSNIDKTNEEEIVKTLKNIFNQ